MRDSFEVSKIFKPIIFADNKTFSFFVYENIRVFHTVNLEPSQAFGWFNVNKLPFNKEKAKYTLSHKVLHKITFHRNFRYCYKR